MNENIIFIFGDRNFYQMLVKDVIGILEELAPLGFAEDFDNVGLLIGDREQEVSGILVCLDSLEEVVDEALEKNCNFILSFHPIIFKGIKKLTGSTYVERAIIKAVRNGIAIYGIHTALDNVKHGVNAAICDKLGLKNRNILIPKKGQLRKLVTYVPTAEAQKLLDALFEAGAGHIGNYSHCSYSLIGTGTFKGGEGTNPAKGKAGSLHKEEETQINITFITGDQDRIIAALLANHPYEEVAYEIFALENAYDAVGLGMVGVLESPMSEAEFLRFCKKQMNTEMIRHSRLLGKEVKKVAVLGGSGAFAINAARASGADAFVTSDLKYHDYFRAEDDLVLMDIGHYESEQFTKNLLVEHLKKKIPNFAILLSERITNPIKYF